MKTVKNVFMVTVLAAFSGESHGVEKPVSDQNKKPKITVIMGSTRQGRSCDKVVAAFKGVVAKRNDVEIELLDLRDFKLPFLDDSVAPARRKIQHPHPAIRKWSKTIYDASAFIYLFPVYNGGYPGVLKNALDLLYREWGNKPVAFISYSGGPSGGAQVIQQLRQVTKELMMKPIEEEVCIPSVYEAFDAQGFLLDKGTEKKMNLLVDALLKEQKELIHTA